MQKKISRIEITIFKLAYNVSVLEEVRDRAYGKLPYTDRELEVPIPNPLKTWAF